MENFAKFGNFYYMFNAMRDHFDINDLVKELKERIKRNNELASEQCSKYLKFGFVLCFIEIYNGI